MSGTTGVFMFIGNPKKIKRDKKGNPTVKCETPGCRQRIIFKKILGKLLLEGQCPECSCYYGILQ